MSNETILHTLILLNLDLTLFAAGLKIYVVNTKIHCGKKIQICQIEIGKVTKFRNLWRQFLIYDRRGVEHISASNRVKTVVYFI